MKFSFLISKFLNILTDLDIKIFICGLINKSTHFLFVLFLLFSGAVQGQGQGKVQTTVLFLGDSLTEGYGVAKEKSYPNLVEQALKQKGKPIKILNGSVNGSTTASGLSRLRWFLKANPNVLLLALGANDGLRGIKLESSEKNLRKIIAKAKERNMKIIIAGMLLPTNYGPEYRTKFEKMFAKLAKELDLTYIPFLLVGVGGEKKMNQEDGIHPNEKGHEKIAQTVLKFLEPLL